MEVSSESPVNTWTKPNPPPNKLNARHHLHKRGWGLRPLPTRARVAWVPPASINLSELVQVGGVLGHLCFCHDLDRRLDQARDRTLYLSCTAVSRVALNKGTAIPPHSRIYALSHVANQPTHHNLERAYRQVPHSSGVLRHSPVPDPYSRQLLDNVDRDLIAICQIPVGQSLLERRRFSLHLDLDLAGSDGTVE